MKLSKAIASMVLMATPYASVAGSIKVTVNQKGDIVACQANMDRLAYKHLKTTKLFLTGEKYIFYDQFFITPDQKNANEKTCCLTEGEPLFGSYPVHSCAPLSSNKMPLLQQELAKLAPTLSEEPGLFSKEFAQAALDEMEGKLAKSWYSKETIKGIEYTRYAFKDVERNKAYRTLYNLAASIVEESLNNATNQSESTYTVMRLGSWYHWYYWMRTKFDGFLNSMRFHKSRWE